MQLIDILPDIDVLLQMAPEELGGAIIEVMSHSGMVTIGHIYSPLLFQTGGYPTAQRQQVWNAIAEAWAWLEGQALIVWPDDGNGRNGYKVLSRRARAIANRAGIEAYRKASLLPKELLHSTI